jgi:hypothetical protein
MAAGFNGTDPDRAAVSRWMSLPSDVEVGSELRGGVEAWDPGAHAHELQRREVARAISDVMKQSGSSGYTSASYTRLTVVAGPGDPACSAAVLTKIAKRYRRQLDDARFEELECGFGGPRLELG